LSGVLLAATIVAVFKFLFRIAQGGDLSPWSPPDYAHACMPVFTGRLHGP